MSSKENIMEIIIRNLNDEASAVEQEELQQWLKEDPSHQSEFENLRLIWNDSAKAALHSFNTENAWQKVSTQISAADKGKVVRMFPWKKAIAIAASILIILGFFYFYNTTSKTEWKEIVARVSNKTIQLPDGTVITLRKGSSLSTPDNYGKDSRKVQLKGEAYFQVHHDEKKPFYLTTDKSLIRDIGTAFLVESNDSIEQVMVTEGKISFSGKADKAKELIVKAGEAAILKEQKPELKIIESKNILSWKTNVLVFDNTDLQQVAEDLKDYYNVDVTLSEDLKASGILVTAQFRNESLENVIKELHLFTGLSIRKQYHNVIISK
ncbi:MAG: FecR domain-containing protein [Bacteroidota bacterium]|nr:FecR domain-containing protein [Bacteroidota bacterium]